MFVGFMSRYYWLEVEGIVPIVLKCGRTRLNRNLADCEVRFSFDQLKS